MAACSDGARTGWPSASALIPLVLLTIILAGAVGARGMRGKPDAASAPADSLGTAPRSDATLRELGALWWPENGVTVAEIQREDDTVLLVRGSSDATRIGIFSYMTPRDEEERRRILFLSRGDSLPLTGVVAGMRLRHLVLDPARADFDARR